MRKLILPSLWTSVLVFGFGIKGCGPDDPVGGWSEYRIDRAGENELIDSHSARMCVSDNGNSYILWIDDRDGSPDIWFNRRDAAAGGADRHMGWLPSAVKINAGSGTDSGTSNVWNPDISCTDAGVFVVWEDDRDGEVESHQIYFQRSTDNGQTWLAADQLLEEDEDGRSNSFNPDILAEGANVYVTWSDNLNGAFDILFIRSTDSGNTFQRPKRIDSDEPAGGAYSAFPRLATGFGGDNVYITWEDFRNGGATVNGGSDVYFARSTDKGQTFGADLRIDVGDDPGASDSFVPKIAADDDDIYIVWHDARFGDANDALMSYSGNGGVTWTPSSPADQQDNRGFNQSLYPEVCLNGPTGHVVWSDNRDNFYRAFYNRAVAGLWEGAEYRLDESDNATGSKRDLRIACDGDNVVASWLDDSQDARSVGFNDIAYEFSTDGGQSWLFTGVDTGERDVYRLDSVKAGTAFKTDVSIVLKGDVLKAAWTDGRAGSTDIYYQQITAGETDVVRGAPSE